MTFEVIILAAGQGTRMRSRLPKVLHQLAGKPMLGHVIDAVRHLGSKATHVVIGHGAERVREQLAASDVSWAEQAEQLGTGHAVAQALPAVDPESTVLIAYGDVPLIAESTLANLLVQADQDSLALLTVDLPDPTGYGRIVRDGQSRVQRIVEQKDASKPQLAIREVNTGILAVAASHLKRWLPRLSADNAQGEYYLTDIIAMAVADGVEIRTHQPDSHWEVQGVNNRQQLAELERHYQRRQAEQLMAEGATLADPARIDVRGQLSVGRDVFIDVGCVFIGAVSLADGVRIGPNCVIENANIGEDSEIKAHSVLESALVGSRCDVGPFARLRPGTILADRAKVGNYVELKNTVLGEGSKANHLAYVGDSEVGAGCNIGAGTITCNYDGANKYKTTMGDNVFIGSNSTLVAPLTIETGGFVAAGSTITKDVPAQQLSVARAKQRNIDGWQRPVKTPK